MHLVTKVLMCGGPVSFVTVKLNDSSRFKALSCTNEMGDFRSSKSGSSARAEAAEAAAKALEAAMAAAGWLGPPPGTKGTEAGFKDILEGEEGIDVFISCQRHDRVTD